MEIYSFWLGMEIASLKGCVKPRASGDFMKNVKIRLSQNFGNLIVVPSSVATAGFVERVPTGKPGLPASESLMLLTQGVVDRLAQQESVVEELILIKRHLSQPLPRADRLEIFRRLNLILGAFFALSEGSPEIFRHCFEIMTHIKEQIDTEPQSDAELAEEEWVEFEKSVYLLSDWEDQIFLQPRPALRS